MSTYNYQTQEWTDDDDLQAEQDAKHAAMMADPAYRKFLGLTD